MRLSTCFGIYTVGAAFLLIPGALWGYLLPVLLWLAAGGLLLFRSLRSLEKGMNLLHDPELFQKYTDKCTSRVVRQMLEKAGARFQALEQQYSASVTDIHMRMGALQSQINPHFLYNTLESIRSVALTQHCTDIAQMSKALGLFFRYSISQKENIVTIQGEVDNIRNYCIIQNYRFDDKFVLEIQIEDENDDVLDCLIPKMTLQPLVENCIFHGLEPKPGAGKVTIRLMTTEDRVILMVSDNGIGMDENQIEKVRRSMETPRAHEAEEQRNGIALYNVNEKLRLVFGSDFGLQIYSTPGLGTDVEIMIPMQRERGALPL